MRVLLVVYDNGSYVSHFPMGLGYLARALDDAGHEVTVYQQDVHHYPDEHLTAYLDRNRFDVACISVIGGYYQYRKLLALSKAIANSKQRPFYVIGGHGPAPDPDYFMRVTGADAIGIGEGERTIVELLSAIDKPCMLREVKGIAWRDGDLCVVNQPRPLIKDIDSIPMPLYDAFDMRHYRLFRFPNVRGKQFTASILSGRGCTFQCNFCYRLDKGHRSRSPEAILDEIGYLQDTYGVTYFSFQDELMMTSKARTQELCEAFLKSGRSFQWWCNGRLNFAEPELLKLMKRAGCVFINYGIESMDNKALRAMQKALTVEVIERGIQATLASGISPGLNIIFGNIGETREILDKDVEFLKKYGDGSQMRTIRPVTPYPGSPLYYYAIKEGLLRDCQDFYENKHVNSDLLAVNFTDGMSDDEVHEALFDANSRLIDDYFTKQKNVLLKEAEDLYVNRNTAFRGFRQV